MEQAEYCRRLAAMNRDRIIDLDRAGALKEALVEPILEVKTDDAPIAVEALREASGGIEVTLFGRMSM